MTALSVERDTPQMGDDAVADLHSLPIAAAVKALRGGICVINASGYAAPATAALNLVAIGRFEETYDNTSGSNGAKNVKVRSGVFRFGNSGTTDALTTADIGKPCYLVDDQTVARTSSVGARSFAGRVMDVDTTGVWVEMGVNQDPTVRDILLVAAASLAALQYTFVALNSSGQAAAASAAGQDCVGVLQNAPASGAIAIVRVSGPSLIAASTTISTGARLATTSGGLSKAAVTGKTDTSDAGAAADALIGSFVMGIALSDGAVSTNHRMLVQPMGAIPTTAA
jgi:hypothetical protein